MNPTPCIARPLWTKVPIKLCTTVHNQHRDRDKIETELMSLYLNVSQGPLQLMFLYLNVSPGPLQLMSLYWNVSPGPLQLMSLYWNDCRSLYSSCLST